jgi:uncharacterized protein (TIGR02266 family)
MNDFTADLNSGGMFLATERLQEVGSTLHLDFALPSVENPIRCLATVAWVNGPGELKKPGLPRGMGIRFLDLSDTDMKAINRLLDSGLAGGTITEKCRNIENGENFGASAHDIQTGGLGKRYEQ